MHSVYMSSVALRQTVSDIAVCKLCLWVSLCHQLVLPWCHKKLFDGRRMPESAVQDAASISYLVAPSSMLSDIWRFQEPDMRRCLPS